MKKRFFALCCALTLLVSAVPAQALTGEGSRAADTLATLNVVRGAYEADAPATRAQAAVILVRLAGAEKAAAADKTRVPFTDMPAYAADAIRYVYHQGWMSPLTGNTFGSGEAVTADAYCAALLRMLGYSGGDFSGGAAVTFARRMAVAGRDYTGALTRGDLFELTAGALTAGYLDGGDTVIGRLVSSGTATAAAASALGLTGGELTARQAADRFTAAVFKLDLFADQKTAGDNTPTSNASGFFISADGLAVTNYHALEGVPAGTATLVSGEQYKIEKVLFYDPDVDIAVIRISTTDTKGVKTPGFVHLDMASRDTLRAGDTVFAIGNPLGLGLAISSGIISDVSREVEGYGLPCIMSTADISQGSSGGALLNAYGQVVGVTSGAYLFGNNMYLAVPIDPVLSADLTGEGKTLSQVAQAEAGRAKTAA